MTKNCSGLAYATIGLCCSTLLACGSSNGGATGTGGSEVGTGGSGTGGSPGVTGGHSGGATGGSSGAGAGLGTGGPFAFPQNKKPGMCNLTTVANAATQTMSAYSSWRSTYVTSSGAGAGMRVQRPENGNDTVSEGIGYGMLASVYMADKMTFDALWTYAQSKLDANGLMTWCIPGGGGSCSGAGSATDGDEDIAWALLMASDQWSSTAYLSAAVAMIKAMRNFDLFTDGSIQDGDNWNGTDKINIDYFSPAYYRAFTAATGDKFWTEFVIDANYKHLAAQAGNDGLVPNSSDLEDALSCQYCDGKYGYDACRTPWRIAMDYCFNGEMRALTYLMKIDAYFSSNGGASAIGDGYTAPNGPQTSSNHNSAFIGPAGVGAMVSASYQTLLDGAFMFDVSNPGGNNSYFAQSLRVLSMLMMSGNFLDYTQQ
jgi:endo-1,4-beta-D-glucanase Y